MFKKLIISSLCLLTMCMDNFAQQPKTTQAKDTFDMSGLPNASNYLDWDYDAPVKDKKVTKTTIKREGFDNSNEGIILAVKRLLEEAPNEFKAVWTINENSSDSNQIDLFTGLIYLKGNAAVENASVDYDENEKVSYVLPVIRGQDETVAEKRMKAIVPILSSLFGKYPTVKKSEGVKGSMHIQIYENVLAPALAIQLINGDLNILIYPDAIDFL